MGVDVSMSASPTDAVERVFDRVLEDVAREIDDDRRAVMSRRELAAEVDRVFLDLMRQERAAIPLMQQREIVLRLVSVLEGGPRRNAGRVSADATPHPAATIQREPAGVGEDRSAALEETAARTATRRRIDAARTVVAPVLLDRIDIASIGHHDRDEIARQIAALVDEIVAELKVQVNGQEQDGLVRVLVDDMTGLGPLESLLADDTVTDIMVNGPSRIYVERGGKLYATNAAFRDHPHVLNVATRIVTRVGRRVDESSPLVDARLEDGSRVKVIMPPLAIDGVAISIRKFARHKLTLDQMVEQANMSADLATVLKIAARARLNILISGGTESGKTTLLNALSQMIDPGERIVTIEDAAELKLQQPHVVRLEIRPANLEGLGEITMRDLLKNALRMRPDRIILGEVRGAEAIDVLQAMNTGHDGSLSTLHANTPRETLTRLENMTSMAGFALSPSAIRAQIADAIDLVVQVSRMRDGKRRVT